MAAPRGSDEDAQRLQPHPALGEAGIRDLACLVEEILIAGSPVFACGTATAEPAPPLNGKLGKLSAPRHAAASGCRTARRSPTSARRLVDADDVEQGKRLVAWPLEGVAPDDRAVRTAVAKPRISREAVAILEAPPEKMTMRRPAKELCMMWRIRSASSARGSPTDS